MTASASQTTIRSGGFTIIELLVATVVFSGLLLILAVTTNQTSDVWRRSAAKVEQFQASRRGFESMTRRLGQATLNTYWDYEYEIKGGGANRVLDMSRPPLGYARQSELRFRCGMMETLAPKEGVLRPTHGVFFQAPLGLTEDDDVLEIDRRRLNPLGDLLNSWGYFVEAGTDEQIIPQFLKGVIQPRMRYRLMQFMEPTERAQIDDPTADPDPSDKSGGRLIIKNENWNLPWDGWFVEPMKRTEDVPLRVLSENILALVILPRLSQQDEAERARRKLSLLAPLYDYDSKRNSNSPAAVKEPLNPNIRGSASDQPEAVNPKNQLPPVVTVAMVAIDELSAQRLAESSASDDLAIGLDWEGLFERAELLEDDPETTGAGKSGDGDLYKLEQQLIAKRINYRVYTSNVPIRGAKWSRSQK
jgi:uncharacterized protein (TIGR02599 family)